MIKMSGFTNSGKKYIGFGLSRLNCERLLKNQPIMIDGSQLKEPERIYLIFAGENENELKKQILESKIPITEITPAEKNFNHQSDLFNIVNFHAEQLRKSRVFICIIDDLQNSDAIACLQLGLAVLMDKPIIVMTTDLQKVPATLRKIALMIDFIDTKNTLNGAYQISQAVERALHILEGK